MDQYQPLLDELLLRMQPDAEGVAAPRLPVTGNPQDEAQFKLNTAGFAREPASAVQTSALPVPGDVNPLARMASISAAGETGTTDFSKGQFNISPDTGGSRSYGIFGLNSGFGRSAGGGSAGQFASSYPSLGLTARPGTPQFDAQWKTAAATMPDQLQGAQLDWYQKNILPKIGEGLTKAGVPDTVSGDPRVQAYFADRSVQQGPNSTSNHANRIAQAAQVSNGDPVQFLRAMSAADRAAIPGDFRTYLAARPQDARGLANRVMTREQMALALAQNGDMPLAIPRDPAEIPAAAAPVSGPAPSGVPVPGQPGAESIGNLPFGIPGTAFSNPIQRALGDNFSTLLAFAGGARQGGIGQGLTQAAKASLTADQQRSLDLQRAQDMAWRRFEAQRAQTNTDRAFGLTRQQFEEGKLPAGYRKTEDGKGMEFIPNGPADPAVIKAQNEAKTGDRILDPGAIKMIAEQYRAGDRSGVIGLAREPRNLKLVQDEIAKQNNEAGTSGADQAQRNAEYFGVKRGQSVLGAKQANIELAATEFKQVLPVVQEASKAVSRTNYPDLNKIIQAYEEKTGDPNIVKFGGGINTLVNLYARAISPQGVGTVHDKEHAREILQKAWSSGQFDAAVGMMQQEIDAALSSPEKVRDAMRKRFIEGSGTPGAAPAAAPAAPVAAPVAPPAIIRMERGPDGVLRRVQQ